MTLSAVNNEVEHGVKIADRNLLELNHQHGSTWEYEVSSLDDVCIISKHPTVVISAGCPITQFTIQYWRGGPLCMDPRCVRHLGFISGLGPWSSSTKAIDKK